MKSNQKGFSAVEGLLISLIVIAIAGIGYYVYSAKKNTDNTYNSAASVSASTKSTAKPKVTPTAPSAASQAQYLEISQFGIKIPLSPAISDLTYKNYGIYSSTILPNKIHQIAPDCASTNTPWNTLKVISTTPPVNGNTDATATVSGKTYYLFAKGGSAPCPDGSPAYTPTASEDSQITEVISDYASALNAAFSKAVAM